MKFFNFIGLIAAASYASAACSSAWGQCGGKNYNGSTCCVSGYKCVELNEWYFQCVPGTDSNTKTTTTTSSAIKTTTTAIRTTTTKTKTKTTKTKTTTKATTTILPTTTVATTIKTTTTSVVAPTSSAGGEIKINTSAGYSEGAYVEFNVVDNKTSGSDYTVSYKKTGTNAYTNVDKELIRINASSRTGRVDIVGLEAGKYDIQIVCGNKSSLVSNITVSKYDRSGYAHYGYTAGVGAYNDNGTLKNDAVVVYVTDATKNTVTATINGKTYTGLVSILQAQKSSSKPLNVRIIGVIKTNQWKSKSDPPRLANNSNLQADTFWKNTYETTYGENLVGLRSKLMDKYAQKAYVYLTTANGVQQQGSSASKTKTTTYKGAAYPSIKGKTVYDDDSYNSMLDIDSAKYVTLEGIGSDSGIFQWGITWSKCSSIEVRNLSFTDYAEDACSFNGSVTADGNIWVHNNIFNKGKNNWDVSGERDKPNGDGAFDLTSVHSVTLSYNTFNGCKKTGLVGGSDAVLNMNISFHHNYYNSVGSRLPLGRQANIHIYNNFYYKCSTAQDIRANAFVLSESNYFEGCTNPQKVTKTSVYTATVIKSFNDKLVSCGASSATVVSSRDKLLSGNCKPDGSTNYTNFDTNSSLFYYDQSSKTSKVNNLFVVDDVKTKIPSLAKPLGGSIIN